MTRLRGGRGGAWAGLIVGVFLGLLFAAGLGAVLLWFVNGALSTGFESYLKKYIFDGPDASFGTVRVDLLNGRVIMTDLKLTSGRLSLTVPELEADVPRNELFSGNGFVRSLQIKNPLVEGSFLLQGGYGEPDVFRFPGWIRRFPIAQVVVTDGQLRLTNRDSQSTWGLRKIEAQLLHPLSESGGGNYRLKLEGQNEAEDSGQFSLDLTLEEIDRPLSLAGEWALRKWPLESLSRFISVPTDVQVVSGRLDLKTQLICKNNWITASHLVDISDFKVEVSPRRKHLLGLPVTQFKDMLDIPSLSFVVPMNGSIHSPQVGIASSVEQILRKVLEGKIENKKDLEKMCRRGGAYLGAKIDAALRARFKKSQ
jgi:hypothetical protein